MYMYIYIICVCVCVCVHSGMRSRPLRKWKNYGGGLIYYKRKATYTSSARPHTLVAEGLIYYKRKATYTSSRRPYTLVA